MELGLKEELLLVALNDLVYYLMGDKRGSAGEVQAECNCSMGSV